MTKSEKEQLLESLRYLKKGLEKLTLLPHEYILLGELTEWYRQHKSKSRAT